MKKAGLICTDTFPLCKKVEDASLKHISNCLNFKTQNLNHSLIAENAKAAISGY